MSCPHKVVETTVQSQEVGGGAGPSSQGVGAGPSSRGVGGGAALLSSRGVGGGAAPSAASTAPSISWQLVMQFCVDHTSILRLAQCSRTCLAAASEPFAWKERIVWFSVLPHAPPAPSRLKRFCVWTGITRGPPVPLATRIHGSRVLRQCGIGIRFLRSTTPTDYAHIKAMLLEPLRRNIRGIYDENDAFWTQVAQDPAPISFAPSFSEIRGTNGLFVPYINDRNQTYYHNLRVLHMWLNEEIGRNKLRLRIFPHVTELHLQNQYFHNYNVTAQRLLRFMSHWFPRLTTLIMTCDIGYDWWTVLDPLVLPHITTLVLTSVRFGSSIPPNILVLFPRMHTLVLHPGMKEFGWSGRTWFQWIDQFMKESVGTACTRVEIHLPQLALSAVKGDDTYWYLVYLDHIEMVLEMIRTKYMGRFHVISTPLSSANEKNRRSTRKHPTYFRHMLFATIPLMPYQWECTACMKGR